jgi:hypothetical protein
VSVWRFIESEAVPKNSLTISYSKNEKLFEMLCAGIFGGRKSTQRVLTFIDNSPVNRCPVTPSNG